MPIAHYRIFNQLARRNYVLVKPIKRSLSSCCMLNKSHFQHKKLEIFHSKPRSNIIQLSNRYFNSQFLRPYVDPKLSYAHGRSQNNFIYSTVGRELERQVSLQPDELAVVIYTENVEKTYKQLDDDIKRVAKTMAQEFGIRKGDTVGVYAYNCYNWILVQYACTQLGAIVTPINPSYKAHELAYILKKGKLKCLFMPGPQSVQRELNNHMEVLQSQEIVDLTNSGDSALENVILMDKDKEYKLDELKFKLKNCKLHNWSVTQKNDGIVFRSEQEADEAQVAPEDAFILSHDLVSPDDIFAVYYTSGTTGKPKGACCSHFLVVNNVRFCQIRMRQGRARNWKITMATTLPMFHIFAGVLNTFSILMGDTKVVYSSYKYDIRAFVESIIKYEVSVTTLTPTILIDMLTYIEQNKLGHDVPLKIIQPGGAALPPELVTRAFKILPHLEDVRCGYGSTENGSVATFQTIFEPEAMRALTVGPPIDFTEVRVVRPGSGGDGQGDIEACVPLGERGEIQTRGYNTMSEYLDDPVKTKEVITPNRWYRTGDIGTMHPHGSLQITGRIKHMIIKGGENIYPEEVEQILLKMEAIEKAHVVGVPDDRFGEQVCAWVKLKPGYTEAKGDYNDSTAKSRNTIHKEDVLKFCRDNITYFKVPKYLLFVDDFPMTPTKKVQSHLMIEETIKILGLKKPK